LAIIGLLIDSTLVKTRAKADCKLRGFAAANKRKLNSAFVDFANKGYVS
jgi:hypothetical protein